jgi:hypothetical protein
VERTTFRVGIHPLSDELSILHFVSLHCYIRIENLPELE